jgi:hypothetical protein
MLKTCCLTVLTCFQPIRNSANAGKFLLLTLFSFCFATSAGAAELVAAQGLTVEEAVALSGVKLEDEKPTAMTAEEKLKVQQPLRNDINYLSENYRPNELDMVVDAVKTLEKNKLRRLTATAARLNALKSKTLKSIQKSGECQQIFQCKNH